MRWDGAPLRPESCVFLDPSSVQLRVEKTKQEAVRKVKEKVDENVYTELYRCFF